MVVPAYPGPTEDKYEAFYMKNILYSYANKTQFCTYLCFESEGFCNSEMAYWNEKTLGTRKRTNDVINFRLVQTNKQETKELLLTAHKWPQKIIQFRVYTVLLSN